MKIIENFLPEDMFINLYNDVNSTYLNWRVAEEKYEADMLLDKLEYIDGNYTDIISKHGFTSTDYMYDIQNVIMLRDYWGARDELNSVPIINDVMSYFDNALDVKIPLRTKLTMSFCNSINRVNSFHTDLSYLGDIKYKTAKIYINDNDGGTLLEDGTFVKSVSNKLVIFDGHINHAPVSQTNTKKRFVLNYNFI